MSQYQAVPAQTLDTTRAKTPLSPLVRLGPIDNLEVALADSWHNVNQATYRFLVLLREFEMRQGWRAYGCNDCAEWLDFKLKISRKTALEKVRVAKALWFLPKIEAAFQGGQLSYSQVRALTRVADQENENALLDRAMTSSACNLERYCQRLRMGDEQSAQTEARRIHSSRTLNLLVQDGSLTAQLPPAELAIVQQALERLVDRLPADPDRNFFAARADALVMMARLVLDSGTPDLAIDAEPEAVDQVDESQEDGRTSKTDPNTAHQVMVHVDASALAGEGGESDYPLPTIKRLCCSGDVLPIFKAGENVLDVGRKQRIVPTRLKRALAARDRQCQFPGCHHTRFLDAHHIKHWCDGGETNLDNLILLCTHHHTLMHEGGFGLQPAEHQAHGKFYFTRPDGRPVDPEMAPSSAEDGK